MSFSCLGQGNDPDKARFRGQNFPTSVQPLADLAPTRWLAERTRPTERGDGVHLWSIIPEGYPAYARILHPAYSESDDTPVRWADIAARNDKTVHPLMQFGRLSGSDDPYGHPYWADKPLVGQLPDTEAKTIISTLRHSTTTPEQCCLLVWEGYGGIELFYPPSEKLELPGRSYLTFTGPVDAVLELLDEGNLLQGPNFWLPEDKAWIVATEIDFVETYVGGSADCINQLLGDPELEAFPASFDARVGFFADTINI